MKNTSVFKSNLYYGHHIFEFTLPIFDYSPVLMPCRIKADSINLRPSNKTKNIYCTHFSQLAEDAMLNCTDWL